MFPERQTLLSEGIGSCHNRAELMDHWRRAAQEYGFEHITLAHAPTPQDRHFSPLVRETTLPSEFSLEFDRLELLKVCPTVTHMARSIMATTWDVGLEGDKPDFDCPPHFAKLFRRFGLRSGVLFTLHALDGGRFMVRYDGNREPPSQAEMNELSMLSTQAFDVFDRLRRTASNTNVLSARELEVVRWTAQGKTSLEIGQILSLSDHTVNAYMTNAIRKLDCVNRTQLVAKAIRMKIIT
ncbi:helix-turn-helix transcriptional regulator [Peteryoungia ipomoeae]|uniref:helix-turn-helix transcriptional regulator n=1 Tax=Peteryoungia ipomoeae TaxID=1210932 RepID=UPI001FE2EE14|nr:LuxR family transcriptional regulator [Peteryoungia ipomoeae]